MIPDTTEECQNRGRNLLMTSKLHEKGFRISSGWLKRGPNGGPRFVNVNPKVAQDKFKEA